MRVLLVFTESYVTPRMGLMYLASTLKAKGHDAQIVGATRLGVKKLRRLIEDFRPAVVGYTALTGEHVQLLRLNETLRKRFSFISVFGGPHATFCPDELMENPYCDAACIGEGDIAFPEFCGRVEAGGPWWETPNFVARHDGKIERNEVLPLVDDLDSLPMPDHDLMYAADPALADDTVKYFYSNRGCPCHCTYCFHSALNKLYSGKGRVVRERSPEKLIDEIYYVKQRYRMTHTILNDDSLLLNSQEWFDRFCADYKQRIGLPFICAFRADLVTEEVIAQLRDAGLVAVGIGVECGNETVFNEVLKRRMTKEQIRRAAAIIKGHGIKLMTCSLCGLPIPNSYETDLETLALNSEIGTDWARASLLYPYPATEIRGAAIQSGFLPEPVPLFESNKRASAFNFPSRRERRRVENLQKLFGILVQFPRLRKHVRLLCELPLGPLYRMLLYVHYGYAMRFIILPFSSPMKEVRSYLPVLFRLFMKK